MSVNVDVVTLPASLLSDLIDLAEDATIIHHKKSRHEFKEIDGELEHWTIDEGCTDNCSGCAREKKMAEVLTKVAAILEGRGS